MGQYISTLFFDPRLATFDDYEAACRNDRVAVLQQILSQHEFTPDSLHRGLKLAIDAGNVASARELLLRGAPIDLKTPEIVLSAPPSKQIPLLDLLATHGWEPSTSHALFVHNVSNIRLLKWFLAHGVNPNYGIKRDEPDRAGGPSYECADALERAASQGSAEAVQILVEAGANIAYGTPLHYAAGSGPHGESLHHFQDRMSEEFDTSRIATMAALVRYGADVNQAEVGPHLNPRYPIVYAVAAGALHRARWLLEYGADPELEGPFGSAVEYVHVMGSEEMKELFERWAHACGKTLPTSFPPGRGVVIPMRSIPPGAIIINKTNEGVL